MIIPNIHVYINADLEFLARLDAHSPNAKAPPDRSIKLIILPIRPHTMISHVMSGSNITPVKHDQQYNQNQDCSMVGAFAAII